MRKFTKLLSVVALCLFGVLGTQAKVEQVHATFENPTNTNTTWTPDASGETKGTFTWSTTYFNQLKNIGLPSGDITGYKKLVVDCEIKSGNQFRILIYKGGSNLTLYASDGLNEFILADTLKALYPDTYNEFLLACDEICLSGNNAAAPGEAVIKDVYLETYNDEGEKVYATFESPTNTNTTWTPDASGETAGTFTWSTTYFNQLKNIGLPSGDISGYKKLVVDTEIKSGNQFRILIYKGGSNLTLYASDGLNEFILADTLKALYPDTYNEFLLECSEICLSGNNAAAPGEAVIKSVYLETYPENESVDIPDIVYEEDPGKPEGDFVDFTEAFPDVQARIGLGNDSHPIVLGNGEVVVGARSKNVVADLSAYSKLTMVTSPNMKLVLYMNHEIDAKQNAGDYTDADAGKYVFMDVQADENGLIEVDLTQFTKQDLNCIALPWDNNNKGTVWYLLLTAAGEVDPLAADKKALEEAITAAKMRTDFGKTEESFAALTTAIANGEAELVNEDATEASLAAAQKAIEDAIVGLELVAGYTNLTQEMFKLYASVDNPGEGSTAYPAYELFTASGLPYGDSNVGELNWADLTEYNKLMVVTRGSIKPRFCINRLVKDGQQAETQEDSKMLDINPNNGFTWSTEKYQTINGNVYTIDLTKIVGDYSFARLHSIKKQGYGEGVFVTDMLLYQSRPVTVGEAGYTTFSTDKAVKLEDVTGYAAKYENGKLNLTAVTEVPAGAGIIIEAAEGSYDLPVIESADALDNDLLVSDGTVTGNGNIFALANGTKGVGFYKVANGQAVPAGKAYLNIAAEAREFIGFGGEATGIKMVENAAANNGEVFNLAGQRVAQPTKGLYIMNGKKVVIK